MKIGVLALQGAFIEHRQMLEQLDVQSFEIRRLTDFEQQMDGLIIPGGESTTIGKLLIDLGLLEPIRLAIQNGLAVFGTCAGLILLSKQIEGTARHYLDALDTVVCRNAYGRQLGSFSAKTDFKGIGEIPAVFIRAPYVKSVCGQAVVLATVDDRIVAVQQNRVLATAFHPELSTDTSVHQYFLSMI